MSYQEKQAIVSLISTLLILGLYSLYLFHNYQDATLILNNDFRFWGKAFLILIPVMIVAQIIIHIIFIIINKIVTNEDVPKLRDERDKLIELKALRISHWVFVLGFLLSMGSQAMGMQPYVMFITLVAAGCLSSSAAEMTKLYLYRKGF
jgi:hypothetical protein